MKCSPDELPMQLKTNLAPLYMVTGDEPFLVNQACDAIRQQAKAQGYSERIRLVADNQFDWHSLFDVLANQSLFSEKRLIDIHVPNAKFGDKGNKVLAELSSSLPEDTLLLITTSKLDAARQRAKWFKALEAMGVIVTVWPLDQRRFHGFIKQQLTQRGWQFQPDVVAYLVAQTEGNLLAAHQEIEKLSLLYPAGPLALSDVETAVSNNSRFDAFKLIDACLTGDPKRIVDIFNRLKQQDTELIFILWAITRECRTLIECQQLISQGQTLGQFARRLGIWPQRQSLIQQALNRLSIEVLQQTLQHALTVDKQIKGMAAGDPWRSMRDCLLNFTDLNPLGDR